MQAHAAEHDQLSRANTSDAAAADGTHHHVPPHDAAVKGTPPHAADGASNASASGPAAAASANATDGVADGAGLPLPAADGAHGDPEAEEEPAEPKRAHGGFNFASIDAGAKVVSRHTGPCVAADAEG